MASSSLKGTRKTYSFEEREILINLINKYEDIEDRKSDPISMCKRKSAWTQLADEYNSMVGPQGARSAVQLRRCWENMKACKRNREEKKLRNISRSFCQLSKGHARSKSWETGSCVSEVPTSTGNVGLPPNVMFEPNDSEPFTLQSVCTHKPLKMNLKREDTWRDSDLTGSKIDSSLSPPEAVGEPSEKTTRDMDSMIVERSDSEETPSKNRTTLKSNAPQTLLTSPIARDRDPPRKGKKSIHRDEEMHVLALSEARMKVDIAGMLKEEAKIKLEEAHYRKEEARLRMLFFTYKLDRAKED